MIYDFSILIIVKPRQEKRFKEEVEDPAKDLRRSLLRKLLMASSRYLFSQKAPS